MSRYVLDTSALLTLHNDEPGSQRVADLLADAAQAKVTVFACFMSQMEVFYRVWKTEGESVGRAAYALCQDLPLTWVHESPELLELAARMKAQYPMSVADAWIAATALQCDATLVHKDPVFEAVQELRHEKLPYK